MKKYCALSLLLLLCVSVWAVDANAFLIGAYSQYQIRYAGSNFADNFDSLGVYLNTHETRFTALNETNHGTMNVSCKKDTQIVCGLEYKKTRKPRFN